MNDRKLTLCKISGTMNTSTEQVFHILKDVRYAGASHRFHTKLSTYKGLSSVRTVAAVEVVYTSVKLF